jgi:hypothetical protein
MVDTVREVMDKQRAMRSAHVEIALQDFLEMSHAEQMEFLAVGMISNAESLNWCIASIQQIIARDS